MLPSGKCPKSLHPCQQGFISHKVCSKELRSTFVWARIAHIVVPSVTQQTLPFSWFLAPRQAHLHLCCVRRRWRNKTRLVRFRFVHRWYAERTCQIHLWTWDKRASRGWTLASTIKGPLLYSFRFSMKLNPSVSWIQYNYMSLVAWD